MMACSVVLKKNMQIALALPYFYSVRSSNHNTRPGATKDAEVGSPPEKEDMIKVDSPVNTLVIRVPRLGDVDGAAGVAAGVLTGADGA